jgi:hypothetical protein
LPPILEEDLLARVVKTEVARPVYHYTYNRDRVPAIQAADALLGPDLFHDVQQPVELLFRADVRR